MKTVYYVERYMMGALEIQEFTGKWYIETVNEFERLYVQVVVKGLFWNKTEFVDSNDIFDVVTGDVQECSK